MLTCEPGESSGTTPYIGASYFLLGEVCVQSSSKRTQGLMNSTLSPTIEGSAHPLELKILFYAAFIVSMPFTLIGMFTLLAL